MDKNKNISQKKPKMSAQMTYKKLKERIKELECLYCISQLVEKSGINLKEILQGIVNLIPRSMQFPSFAFAKIQFDQKIYQSSINPSSVKNVVIKSKIMIQKKNRGEISIGYKKSLTPQNKTPFLKEEIRLLKAITQRTGKIITRHEVEAKLKNLNIQTERENHLVNKILKIMNFTYADRSGIKAILLELQKFANTEAVGIRMKDGLDYPYYATTGFSENFVEMENYLCHKDPEGNVIKDSEGKAYLECMCGNILLKRTDAKLPFFTRGGSFWSNNTTKLLAESSDEDRQTRTRNRCNSEGYESVALIPIKTKNEIIGLMQFNDMRRGKFDKRKIEFLEEVGYFIGVAFSRVKNAKILKDKTKLNQLLLDSFPHPAMIIDSNRKVLAANKIALDLGTIINDYCWKEFGNREFLSVENKKLAQKNPDLEGIQCTFCKADQCLSQQSGENDPHVPAFGKIWDTFWIGIDENLFLHYAIDITERINSAKALQETRNQLHHSERLAATGRLSASIAHEINNPLQAIGTNLSFIEKALPQNFIEKESLTIIREGLSRIEKTVSLLLDIHRTRPIQNEILNLNESIKSSLRLFKNRLQIEHVNIVQKLSKPDLLIRGNSQDFNLIIMNLIINAQDAIDKGGTIWFSTKKIQNRIIVKIRDDGCGITKDNVSRIFDPFFTTKTEMLGTGIGLSTSKGIIESFGGKIEVKSSQGKGTTFTLSFPGFIKEN